MTRQRRWARWLDKLDEEINRKPAGNFWLLIYCVTTSHFGMLKSLHILISFLAVWMKITRLGALYLFLEVLSVDVALCQSLIVFCPGSLNLLLSVFDWDNSTNCSVVSFNASPAQTLPRHSSVIHPFSVKMESEKGKRTVTIDPPKISGAGWRGRKGTFKRQSLLLFWSKD